jgi:uncharacterized protein involved in response to NO
MNDKTPVLLSYAFRPFFLLNGFFAVLVVVGWTLALHGKGLAAFTVMWHGHEMLVGFSMAAIAGFSLTAVSVWTGRPALNGAPITWLVFCWLLGRLAMLSSTWIAAPFVATVDMLFPVLLCLLLGREVFGGKNRRNFLLVVIVAVMAGLNGLYHLGTMQLVAGGDRLGVYLLIHMVLLLVAIIAGRIVPSFTGNWLRLQGEKRLPKGSIAVDISALSLTVLTGLATTLWPSNVVSGVLAFAAAGVHGFRLSRWRGFATTSNPLLFVLHGAYAWLPVGYVLLGCAVFGWTITPSAALHALTMGAIGSTVLAVTTRVALGHTGRPLKAARSIVAAYWILMIAVLARVVSPLAASHYRTMVDLAAAGWALAFVIFIAVYWPILTREKAG